MSPVLNQSPGIDPRTLPQPPPVLPLWAKVLYYLVETAAIGVTYLAYDQGSAISPAQSDADDPLPNTWRKFVYRFENVQSDRPADDQYLAFEIGNISSGILDSTWTDADYTAVTNHLNVLIAGLAPHIVSYLACTEVKAYIRGFNPYSITDKPFADSGPPEYFDTFNVAMSGNGAVAPQVTSTITEMTAARAHWGRLYIPTLAALTYGPAGRLTTSAIDTISGLFNTCYTGLMNQQFMPLVATTQSGGTKNNPAGTATRTVQTVSGLRMDDVYDVVRRRRYRDIGYSHTYPLPAELEELSAA